MDSSISCSSIFRLNENKNGDMFVLPPLLKIAFMNTVTSQISKLVVYINQF